MHTIRKKSAAILPQLQFKRSMEYARQKIMDYALCNVEKGALRPGIPIRSILLFVSSFVDGIYQSVALNTQGGEGLAAASDISEMFQTLAKAVVGFLEESVETGGETPRDRT